MYEIAHETKYVLDSSPISFFLF